MRRTTGRLRSASFRVRRWALGFAMVVLLGLRLGMPALASQGTHVLTLRDALEIALSAHPDVVQAAYDLRKAELDLVGVRAQVTLPSIQVDLRPFTLAEGESFPGTTQGSIGFSLGLTTGTSLGLELSPRYNWAAEEFSFSWKVSLSQRYDPARPIPSEARALTDAEAKVASGRLALAQARENVLLSLVQSYGNLLSSEVTVADAQRSLARARDALAAVGADVAAGQAGQLQLLEAEIALRDAEITVRKRGAAHTSAFEEFARSVGLNGPVELQRTGNISEELLQRVDELLARAIPREALAMASAVRAANDAVTTAEEKLWAVQAAGWPVPSASLTWSEGGWRVGFSLSLSLFAPDRRAQKDIAQAELELARDRLASAWQEAERSILQAKSALEEAREAVAIMGLEREKLILERAAAELRQGAGLIGPADWEAFVLREERFETDYEQRLFSLLQAYLRYQRALGLELDWEGMIR